MNNLLNGLLVVASGVSLFLSSHCQEQPSIAEPAPRPGWHEPDHAQAIAYRLGGESEVTLPDRTRCDVLTDRTAYEVEWAPKWYQGVGQSLHYSVVTGRQPGIVLLVREDERRYVRRCRRVCERYGIKLRVQEVTK